MTLDLFLQFYAKYWLQSSDLFSCNRPYIVVAFSGALLEYAVILLLLKKRRKPRRTIDEGESLRGFKRDISDRVDRI